MAKRSKNSFSLSEWFIINLLKLIIILLPFYLIWIFLKYIWNLIIDNFLLIWIISLIVFISITSYYIFSFFYFKSKNFKNIKQAIKKNVNNCNDFNSYIQELKKTYIKYRKVDYGSSQYIDKSIFKFKRPYLNNKNKHNTLDCSLAIFSNAQRQPFKYICKYFNIPENEKSLEEFEKILNNFTSVEQGKKLLLEEQHRLFNNISKDIPWIIKIFSYNTIIEKLGFNEINFKNYYFPTFNFRYISAGGNSSMNCKITLDLENLNKFIQYLADIVQQRNSILGQRALMTNSLREKIKKRDNYTCKICHLSIVDEPNLLLEIDHIIPLSKGGKTTEDNLQTLCWRCNRNKGNKIY